MNRSLEMCCDIACKASAISDAQKNKFQPSTPVGKYEKAVLTMDALSQNIFALERRGGDFRA